MISSIIKIQEENINYCYKIDEIRENNQRIKIYLNGILQYLGKSIYQSGFLYNSFQNQIEINQLLLNQIEESYAKNESILRELNEDKDNCYYQISKLKDEELKKILILEIKTIIRI